ncbi:unnamed protein product [Rhizophagus irregularis]|nr:unnamed protein product [Rhizophagus irregularis]
MVSRKLDFKRKKTTHDIPEEMTIATLWNDRKPTTFLTSCGASVFKIIQTSKGKRKLVGYFENWEATLKALDTPQVFLTLDKELKWCQHSLKKQHKLNQSKKKDKKSSTKLAKDDNELKILNSQKKAKKFSKSKGRNKGNNEVLAEILNLLRILN